jgi:acetyl-CoA synthetase
MLRPGVEPSAERAQHIMSFVRDKVPPYKRVRRLEFGDLPKTISGKIRRVELRALEEQRRARGERGPLEFFEDDFPQAR